MVALADAAQAAGVDVREGVSVDDVRDDGAKVLITDGHGQGHRFDAVVIATGAHLAKLAREHGMRQVVQAGRGYSFTVNGEKVPTGPVYFPTQRVACTPLTVGGERRLRVAGMMEFRGPDEPLDPRRVDAIVAATRGNFTDLDFDERHDEWVGSRPCTTDGMPLIGRTRSDRIFVAGGHGMWGIVLGPLTGRLLTEQILEGTTPPELRPFDPLRQERPLANPRTRLGGRRGNVRQPRRTDSTAVDTAVTWAATTAPRSRSSASGYQSQKRCQRCLRLQSRREHRGGDVVLVAPWIIGELHLEAALGKLAAVVSVVAFACVAHLFAARATAAAFRRRHSSRPANGRSPT